MQIKIMKSYNKNLKIIAVLIIFSLLICCFAGCNSGENDSKVTKLSFKEASGYDFLKTLDGRV